MTQLALTAAGYAIGSYFGFPQLGAAVGTYVGGVLAAPDVAGPRLSDSAVQISSYGAALPKPYGGIRVAGNVIWSADLVENASEEGAKGGPTVTTFSYSASFAVAVGDGYVNAIRRIWLDAVLAYDISEDASPETQAASEAFSQYFVFYQGTEVQTADPTIESYEGAGNVEAYRGTAYLVFTNLPLERFGNRIPQVRVETTTETPTDAETTFYEPLEIRPWELTALGPRHSGGGEMEFIVYSADGDTDPIGTYDNFNDAQAVLTGLGITEYIGYYTSASVDSVLDRFQAGGAEVEISLNNGTHYAVLCFNVEQPTIVEFDGTIESGLFLCSALASAGAPDPVADNPDVWMFSSTSDIAGHNGHAGLIRFDPFPGTTREGYNEGGLGTTLNNCTNYAQNPPPNFPVAKMSLHYRIRIQRLPSLPLNTCYPGDPLTDGIAELPGNPLFCLSSGGDLSPNLTYVEQAGSFRQLRKRELPTSIYDDYPQWLPLGPVLPSGHPDFNNQAFWDAEAAAAGITGTYGVDYGVTVTEAATATSAYAAAAAGSVLLSEIVTEVCLACGLTEDQIDVTELDDVVLGYQRARVMQGRAALEALRQAYYFDAVESGDIIRFVKRGAAPAASLTAEDLGAGLAAAGELINSQREQQTELPAAVVVSYYARSADYQTGTQQSRRRVGGSQQVSPVELPIVMTDQKAAEVAEVINYEPWASRVRRTISITRQHSALEPTDVLSVDDGEFTYRLRVIEKSEDQGVITLTCIDDDADVYSPNATAGAISGGGAVVRFDGPTNLLLLDIPILRDQDDDASYYVAACSFGTSWRGARLFRSTDDGANYTALLDLNREATIGQAASALGTFAGGNVVDELNYVDVNLARGTLASITRAQLLNNGNVCLLGDEVLQFQRAVLQSGTTWRLSGLLRARAGTYGGRSTHALGEMFVLLTPSTIYRPALGAESIAVDTLHSAVTFGSSLADSYEREFTNTANGLRPIAPAHLQVIPVGSDHLVRWTRQTRINGTWRNYSDVPLGEEDERYSVIGQRGEEVLFTALVTDESELLVPASVGLIPGDTIYVAQMSTTVGPGAYSIRSVP